MNEMRVFLIAALGFIAFGQEPPKQPKPIEGKGLPPRLSATDYQAHAKAGDFTIAAEFPGHSVPVEEGNPLTTEDYITVEAAVFGPPGAHIALSHEEFSLRINGKKNTLASQPFELVFKSLKDPDWEPPPSADKGKSKTSIGGGGGGNDPGSTPAVVHIPIEIRHAMELKVRRAALLSGDRPLPQAGLLFFSYRGKPTSITSLELIYEGPAGKATLNLQP